MRNGTRRAGIDKHLPLQGEIGGRKEENIIRRCGLAGEVKRKGKKKKK